MLYCVHCLTKACEAESFRDCMTQLRRDLVVEVTRLLSSSSCSPHLLQRCLLFLLSLQRFGLSADELASLLRSLLLERVSSLHSLLASQPDALAANLPAVSTLLFVLRKFQPFFSSTPSQGAHQKSPFELNPQVEIIRVFAVRGDAAVKNSLRAEDVETMGVYDVNAEGVEKTTLLRCQIHSALFVVFSSPPHT